MVAVAELKFMSEASVVRPGFAVVFHQDSGRNTIVCATRHKVNPNTNTLSIGTIISAAQIAKSFADLNIDQSKRTLSCIPENVIFDSSHLIIWYKRRFIGDMWFRHGNKPQRLVVEWPPLLFAAFKLTQTMHIYALANNTRPHEATVLYNAPLMNLSGNGILCQGTAHLPLDISKNTIAECETTLINSQFTHVNHNYTFRHKTDNKQHFAFWKSKARTLIREPLRLLTKEMALSGITLAEFIQEYAND